jgi:hypothetical protein
MKHLNWPIKLTPTALIRRSAEGPLRPRSEASEARPPGRPIFLGVVFFILAIAPSFVSAAQLGNETRFFVDAGYDTQSRDTVTATLRVEGENAHYYVENDFWRGLGFNETAFLASLQDLRQEFDSRIYPLERQHFGFEPNPGIDGDPKITVLLTPLVPEAGGYFLLGNGFSKARISVSNEREMVYLNADLAKVSRWPVLLAHEFQHLVTFGAKELRINKNEEVWLNELRSEYAVTLLGYDDQPGVTNLIQRARSFLRQPEDALLSWRNQNADYGIADMFAHYLVDSYGTKILRETLDASLVGIAAIEEALKTRGIGALFKDIYAGWVKTNFLGGYKHPALKDLRAAPSTLYNISPLLPLTVQSSIEPWSMQSYAVQSTVQALEVGVSGDPGESWLLMVMKKNDSTASPAAHHFTGSKTVSFAADGESVIVVAVNTTQRAAPPNEAIQSVPYTLSLKALSEVPVVSPTPSPLPSLVPTPTPTSSPSPLPRPSFPDGALIRERDDTRVWIVNGSYIRQIAHPLIFTFYLHLKWENVVEVEPGAVGQFKQSTLLRALGDTKVYEVDAAGARSGTAEEGAQATDDAGVRRWLNMAPEQFVASGRSWEAVYVVNERERDFYRLLE